MSELLTPGQVADILDLSTERVRQLGMSGVLFPVANTGRGRLYTRENVDAILAARKASDEIRRRFADAGKFGGDEMADAEFKRLLRDISRRNFTHAHKRARERLQEMQRRLEQLDVDRVVIAAELEVIEAERAHLVATIERLAAELGTKGH